MSNRSALDDAIWSELRADWDNVALRAADQFSLLVKDEDQSDAPIDAEDSFVHDYEGKTRTTLVESRVNQHLFRQAVLVSYDATCCISGLRGEQLMVASHIVPWSRDTKNRLNPSNGLCLSALHDKAYDQGLLTVLPDHTIQVSSKLREWQSDGFMHESLLKHHGERIALPERFAPNPEFLGWHAQHFGYLK